MRNGTVKVEALPDGSIAGAQSFIFNLRRAKWQDPRVREAVRLMFNFEWSNESLFFGLYERVNSFWENSDLEARGAYRSRNRAVAAAGGRGTPDASILTDEAVMAPTSGQNFDRRNLRAASALLDEAGWEIGDDGVRRKDGQELTLVVLSFSPAFDRIINPYIENLNKLGLRAKLDRVDVVSTSTVACRRYDITTHTFSMGLEPGFSLRRTLPRPLRTVPGT